MSSENNSSFNQVSQNLDQDVQDDEHLDNFLGILGSSVASSSQSLAQIQTLQNALDLLLKED